MAVDFMDGRTGWGVVRREFGAKATRQGTGRESRRRRHERRFRPRRMRNMVRSRSTSGTVAAASRPREGQRDRGARRIREPPSRGEEDARGDREDGPRSGGIDRHSRTAPAVERRRPPETPTSQVPKDSLPVNSSCWIEDAAVIPRPSAAKLQVREDQKMKVRWTGPSDGDAVERRVRLQAWPRSGARRPGLYCPESDRGAEAVEEAAEPACFACTVRPSFRAGREDWEAATIRDAR